jgi:hypothetical protein
VDYVLSWVKQSLFSHVQVHFSIVRRTLFWQPETIRLF